MSVRLVALDEGPDIMVDHAMVIVGRHPQCDARIDSIRVSRRHCCMTPDHGELVVRDLGSTNGIRINGQRVEMGRLRAGDELSIAHMRYRLDVGGDQEVTLADGGVPPRGSPLGPGDGPIIPPPRRIPMPPQAPPPPNGLGKHDEPADDSSGDNALAAAVRELLPAGVADRCRIKVIVQMQPETDESDPHHAEVKEAADACRHDSSP